MSHNAHIQHWRNIHVAYYAINLITGDDSNVIPLIRLINVDFAKQLPADFIEPLPLSRQNLAQPLRLIA